MTRADLDRKVRSLARVIAHPRTGEGERAAATNAVNRLLGRHGLAPEDFGFYCEITDDEWQGAFRFFNQGWSGEGWRPSDLAVIGDSVFATDHVRGRITAEQASYRRHRFRRHILERARGRWRDGFHPNPFTLHPIPRAAEARP